MSPHNKGVWKYSNSSAKQKAISKTSTVDGINVGVGDLGFNSDQNDWLVVCVCARDWQESPKFIQSRLTKIIWSLTHDNTIIHKATRCFCQSKSSTSKYHKGVTCFDESDLDALCITVLSWVAENVIFASRDRMHFWYSYQSLAHTQPINQSFW